MKTLIKNSRKLFVVIMAMFVISGLIYAYSTGITGRTKKSASPGCTCHGFTPSNSVNVVIAGPDTVAPNQSATYTLTISGGPLVRAGTNIAAGHGSLNVLNSTLQKIGAELTHVSPIPPNGGAVSVQFSYTAPAATGPDTIFANGNSVNFDGTNSGDQWNFAPNKIIIVGNTNGIKNISTTASQFELSQNYPNPFNPVTNIKFSIPESGIVKMTIFDITGKEIARPVNERMSAGSYTLDFDASALTSGVYFYTLTAGNFTDTKRMMLVK